MNGLIIEFGTSNTNPFYLPITYSDTAYIVTCNSNINRGYAATDGELYRVNTAQSLTKAGDIPMFWHTEGY